MNSQMSAANFCFARCPPLVSLKLVPQEDEVNIHFDRVHRLSLRQASSNSPNVKPRPIIVKLSDFHNKQFIKSFIKNLTKGCNFGISDDFPREVQEIRKKLYPVLKAAK